jgi:hypothetical protein
MSPGARAALTRLQPFHRRTDPLLWSLWQLEELANVDKHRDVHVTGATMIGTSFTVSGAGVWVIEKIEAIPRPIVERAIVGRCYGTFDPPPAVSMDAHIAADVMFAGSTEATSVRGESVVGTLATIREAVALRVVPALAAELARLFPQQELVLTFEEAA